MSFYCEYCDKELSEEKGELAHGCLHCHGTPWVDKIFWLNKSITQKDARIAELGHELNQQRFNNQHNLSIDQKVSDRIMELEQVIAEMAGALGFYSDTDMYKAGSDVTHSLGFDGEVYETELIATMKDNGKRARSALTKFKSLIEEVRGKK